MVVTDGLHLPQAPFNVALTPSAISSWAKSTHRLLKTSRSISFCRTRARRARMLCLRIRRAIPLDIIQDLTAELEAAAMSPVNAAPSCATAPGYAPSRSAARGCSVLTFKGQQDFKDVLCRRQERRMMASSSQEAISLEGLIVSPTIDSDPGAPFAGYVDTGVLPSPGLFSAPRGMDALHTMPRGVNYAGEGLR